MKRSLIILLLLTAILASFAQVDPTQYLQEIELNNTELKALRHQVEALKFKNRSGIYPDNPELEFGHLWSNPDELGIRTDFSVSQSFEFPTVYRHRSKIAHSKNEQAELEYQKKRKAILHEANLLIIDLIYTNAVQDELNRRIEHAGSIAQSVSAEFEVGETTILAFNKAKLNLLHISKEQSCNQINREAIIAELDALNSGVRLEIEASTFLASSIPLSFEDWYKDREMDNPELNWLNVETGIADKELKLSRAMSAPGLKAGFMSEKVAGEQFQGLTLGVTVPLWANKNRIRQARAKIDAIESLNQDRKSHYYLQLKASHSKAVAMQTTVEDYRTQLRTYDNTEYLIKALEAGEITLIEYIMELSIYNQSIDLLMTMERDKQKAIAEFNRFNL